MAGKSDRIAKANRSKKPVQHQKNHRWESFTSRVAKLHSLNPLRKVRRDLDEEDLSSTTSYFRNGLEKWTDHNLTRSFTAFRRAVAPLCESLPQILHFEDRIMDLLADGIEQAQAQDDREALEPLLILLTEFARDLGTRFVERGYDARAFQLLVGVATQNSGGATARPLRQANHDLDVSVIEWTFTALAFLFKYLFMLLVADLRPTYDILSVLLGAPPKDPGTTTTNTTTTTSKPPRIPGHIARFAAEALSFLVKKAANPSRRQTALPLIVNHVRDDLLRTGTSRPLYTQAVMTLFAEAVKGTGESLVLSGPPIYVSVLHAVPADELVPNAEGAPDVPTPWGDVCCGVLTSLIHHASPEALYPLIEAIVQEATDRVNAANKTGSSKWALSLYVRLIGVLAGVRGGAKVKEWSDLLQCLSQLVGSMTRLPFAAEQWPAAAVPPPASSSTQIWRHVVVNVAIVWSNMPEEVLPPYRLTLTEPMIRDPFAPWFIPFCAYVADLHAYRFRRLMDMFKRFISSHWSDAANEDLLCVLLARMTAQAEKPLSLPRSWQDQIVSRFEQLEATPFPESGPDSPPDPLPKYAALLDVLDEAIVHQSTSERIAEVLLRKLRLALRPAPPQLDTNAETAFLISQGFRAYMNILKKLSGKPDPGLRPLLRAAAPRFARQTGFLEALLQYEEATRGDHSDAKDQDDEEDPFVTALVANLAAPSHDLRLVSLQLLQPSQTDKEDKDDQSDVLAAMLQIEMIPATPQNARSIAAHLRKLALSYAHIPSGSWLQAAVPAFLFGLLSVRLAPVWDDAVAAMQKVAQTNSAGESAIIDRALDWLDVPSPRRTGGTGPLAMSERRLPQTDFECFKFSKLLAAAQDAEKVFMDPAALLREAFRAQQEAVVENSGFERGKALRVLTAMPSMAEKRSRRLVPHLLSWTEDRERLSEGEEGDSNEDDDAEENTDNAEADQSGGWSFADKKALIGVFSRFSNASALYQSSRARSALLKLLANGDAEIQRLALRSLMTWRDDALKRNREALERLLDDGKFKNELTLLLQGTDSDRTDGDDNNHALTHADRAALMPVLLHLLYGRAIAKRGAASGRQGLHATRLFIVRSLDAASLGGFLRIALGRLEQVRVMDDAGKLRASLFGRGAEEVLTARKQVGVLNMLEPIITELGDAAGPYMDELVNATLYCLFSACRGLRGDDGGEEDGGDDDGDDEEEDGDDDNGNETKAQTSLLRVAKTTALRCLCELFRNSVDSEGGALFDWTPYRAAIVGEVVSPGIERLAQESTQGASWTWRLLDTWTRQRSQALFLAVDARVLPQILGVLALAKAKDGVKMFALEMVQHLVALADSEGEESPVAASLLVPNLNTALQSILQVLSTGADISRQLLQTCVDTAVAVAPLVEQSAHVRSLVDVATSLLNQPARRVSPRIKGTLLQLLERFVRLEHWGPESPVYATVAALFSYFKDRENRQWLCRVLAVFADTTAELQPVAQLCFEINAYAAGQVDEPDYDVRVKALDALGAATATPLSLDQWRPLLHNALFFLRQDEELGVLSKSAAAGLCRFVTDATDAATHTPRDDAHAAILSDVVLPALYGCARDPSETVRGETVRVFGHLISTLRAWPPVRSLAVLVPEAEAAETDVDTRMEDVETPEDSRDSRSFFEHILRPVVDKQMQAMQVLGGASERHRLGSKHVARFFIPLLECFVTGRTDGADDHGLGAQATQTIGQLAGALEWPQYRALLRRYVTFVGTRPELQKQVVRLLERVVDALVEGRQADKKNELAASAPADLTAEVNSLAGPLLEHLHDKDEATVSARVPVAIVVVKLLTLLPQAGREQALAAVLTDTCHILRSKAWDAREMARATLARIAVLLGPATFGFLLQQLRGALTRGYQLHVLSFTVHALLLAVIPTLQPGELDGCAEAVVAVVMDDTFGAVGQEKEATDYISTMKEVKSSKSKDSLRLLAENVSVARLGGLVQPLRALLQERINLRTARKIDALFDCIAAGVVRNGGAGQPDTLVFCYEVIREAYRTTETTNRPTAKMDPRVKRFLYQKSERNNVGARQASQFTYKLIRFALDLLLKVLRRFDGLRTAAHLAGLVGPLGDAVLGGPEAMSAEEVQIAAFKVLAAVARVPFPAETEAAAEFAKLYRVAQKEAIVAVEAAPSLASERAQAGLKLLAVVLRSRAEVPVRPATMDRLLARIQEDLTEPAYRSITFHFVRAVLGRGVASAQVYDTLDHISRAMITNDDADTRSLARGAYLKFLLGYPQSRARWEDQLAFLADNLGYDLPSGRLSVMAVISVLLHRLPDDAPLQALVGTCFLDVVFVVANDRHPTCRRAAALLLRQLMRHASAYYLGLFLGLYRQWLAADEAARPPQVRMGLVAFSLYFAEAGESTEGGKKMAPPAQSDVEAALDRVAELLGRPISRALAGAALETAQVLAETQPAHALNGHRASVAQLWRRVEQCLWHEAGTVRRAAMQLLSPYLADFQAAPAGSDRAATGSNGLVLLHADVARLVCGALRVLSLGGGLDVDAGEAEDAARMLVHLGGYLLPEEEEADEDEGDGDEDEKEEEKKDDDEKEEDDDDEEKEGKRALDRRYVYLRLARIVRRETPPRASALVPKAAALAVWEAYCQSGSAPPSSVAVSAILRPLRHLTDRSVAAPVAGPADAALFAERYDALRQRAEGLLDRLQALLGTAAFTRHLLAVNRAARARRQQRASKRKIAAVTRPEQHGRDKRRRTEAKKERRKAKGQAHRDARKAY